MRFARTAFAALSVLVSAAACASAEKVEAPTETLRARDFFPLAVGNTWTYQLTPAPPDQPTEEVKILDRDQAGFFVDNKGGKLAPRTDGVFDGQRFILQEPLEEGREWMAVPDPKSVERFKLSAVGTQATVPAGTFSGCVEVETRAHIDQPMRGNTVTTWTYAPHVGLVRFKVRFTPDAGGEPADVVKMELVKYQVKATE